MYSFPFGFFVGGNGLPVAISASPFVHSFASFGSTSTSLLGLDKGSMMGRSHPSAKPSIRMSTGSLRYSALVTPNDLLCTLENGEALLKANPTPCYARVSECVPKSEASLAWHTTEELQDVEGWVVCRKEDEKDGKDGVRLRTRKTF